MAVAEYVKSLEEEIEVLRNKRSRIAYNDFDLGVSYADLTKEIEILEEKLLEAKSVRIVKLGDIITLVDEEGAKRTFVLLAMEIEGFELEHYAIDSEMGRTIISKALNETFELNGKKYTVTDIK